MPDPERDQNIRMQICIHMRVQICPEFALPADVGLHKCLSDVKPVILGLAHQRLCDRRDHGLLLDPPVRIDVCHLCISQTKHIDQSSLTVKIAWNLIFNDHESVCVIGQ